MQYKKRPVFPKTGQLLKIYKKDNELHSKPVRDFGANERLENADILCVFQIFQSAQLSQKLFPVKKK